MVKLNNNKSAVKKKRSRNIVNGVMHIYCTFNNTNVTISDLGGNVITWSSSGKTGF